MTSMPEPEVIIDAEYAGRWWMGRGTMSEELDKLRRLVLDTETVGEISLDRDAGELVRILDEVQQIAARLAALEAKLDSLTRRLTGPYEAR